MSEGGFILVVGAGRSGTNFLTRALAEHPGNFNCFESRFIWNTGQRDKRFDWRCPTEVTPAVQNAIRQPLRALAPSGGTVIDKTPGNALRLDFARAVLPDAKIVNIIRDGRASLASRMSLWGDDLEDDAASSIRRTGERLSKEFSQFLAMLRRGNIPLNRVPAFALDSGQILFGNALGRPRLGGERVAGLLEIAKVHGFEIARAVQWRETVVASVTAGREMPEDVYFEFRFEDLLRRPEEVGRQLVDFLEMEMPNSVIAALTEKADPSKAEAWRAGFSPERLARLEPVLRPTLDWLGYA